MEMKINTETTVQVEPRLSIFHTTKPKKPTVSLYLRNESIVGGEIGVYRFFSLVRFAVVFVLAVLGGVAHFIYDTEILQFNPNPPLIAAIVLAVFVVGLPFTTTKKYCLKVLVNVKDNHGINPSHFYFPIGKEITEKELNDLLYLLAT